MIQFKLSFVFHMLFKIKEKQNNSNNNKTGKQNAVFI